MQNISTSVSIQASPATVWKVLMDFDEYPEWNPFVTSIVGKALPGEHLSIELSRKDKKPMSISPTVVTAETEACFAWVGSVGLRGIFDGHHQFVLDSAPGGTQLQHFEEFTGLLVPLVLPSIRTSTTAGFVAMNDALKDRAENYGLS